MSSFSTNHRSSSSISRISLLIFFFLAIQLLIFFNQQDAGGQTWLQKSSVENVPRRPPIDATENIQTGTEERLRSRLDTEEGYQQNGGEVFALPITALDVHTSSHIVPALTGQEYEIVSEIQTRVACIIPYTGTSLPAWFDAFAFSAYSSSPLFDFLIFVTEIPLRDLPPNVKIIQITKRNLYERIARLQNNEEAADIFEKNVASIQNLIDKFPYVLVEFKPCLGTLFADYLEEYSHWGLADLDLIVGEMHKIITPQMLNKYDIYTSSFGDSYRIYLRGQLTIHKNNPIINNLWRKCDHLSNLSKRLDIFSVNNNEGKSWSFHSSEGCYSSIAVANKNISIFVDLSQISEAYSASVTERESFVFSRSLFRCFDVPVKITDSGFPYLISYKDDNLSTQTLRNISSLEFQDPESQSESDWHQVHRLPTNVHENRCTHWIAPEFEICIDPVPVGSMIKIISGNIMYKEAPPRILHKSKAQNCKEYSISHFQGWKRNYFHFFTRPPPLDSHITLISESGFIPFQFRENNNQIRERTYGALLQIKTSLGRISADDVLVARGREEGSEEGKERGSVRGSGKQIPRLLASHLDDKKNRKIMSSEDDRLQERSQETEKEQEKEQEKVKESIFGLATSYCAAFSTDLKKCTCHVRGENIRIYPYFGNSGNRNSAHNSGGVSTECTYSSEVTLITVMSRVEFESRAVDRMLHNWCGPKIVVVGVMEPGPEIPEIYQRNYSDLTVIEVDVRTCVPFMQIQHGEHSLIPDNVLFNIGLDAAHTDLVLLSPSYVVYQSTTAQMIENILFSTGFQWGGLGSRNPMALVVPVFEKNINLENDNILKNINMKNDNSNNDNLKNNNLNNDFKSDEEKEGVESREEEKSQERSQERREKSREKVEKQGGVESPYSAYPPEGSWCGENQSKLLRRNYTQYNEIYAYRNHSFYLDPLVKNTQEFLLERTLMLPVAYNTKAGPHGSGFIRFPEEFNGPGCFGSIFLHIMMGSGFSLFWAPFNALIKSESENFDFLEGGYSDNSLGDSNISGSGSGGGSGSGSGGIHIHDMYTDMNMDNVNNNEKNGGNLNLTEIPVSLIESNHSKNVILKNNQEFRRLNSQSSANSDSDLNLNSILDFKSNSELNLKSSAKSILKSAQDLFKFSCGCLHVNNPHVSDSFIKMTNMYYERASKLRKEGLSPVYSKTT